MVLILSPGAGWNRILSIQSGKCVDFTLFIIVDLLKEQLLSLMDVFHTHKHSKSDLS